jgi:predicted ATPase/transcriptional regulator with XRE-family HTH domain
MVSEDSFGLWLSKCRKSLGLTQKQLASQVHCAIITIRKIESEQRRPSIQIAERLAQILNIPDNEHKKFIVFARGDWRSASNSSLVNFPWTYNDTPSISQLPNPITPLIGREQELSSIVEYFLDADTRLVTISGPPGIGKTRISQDVARSLLGYFPGGVFFIPLTNLENSHLLTQTIIQSLGYKLKQGESPEDMLITRIADQHILLVLDNVEHLIDAVERFVFKILESCSHLKILVTSREILRISGEKVFQLSGLSMPVENHLTTRDFDEISKYPALKLFEERANAAKPDFFLSQENLENVYAICRHLDGLPLAIELLAVWIKIMTPHALFEGLSNHLVLHTEGSYALPVHQRTLYNAINWSYNLLSPQEKFLFNHLSVFTGGFSVKAAEKILSDNSMDAYAADIIAALVEKSLILRGADIYNEPRFYMLTTIKQFASEQLTMLGGLEAAQEYHLEYYVNFTLRNMGDIQGSNRARFINRLEFEQDNLRSALNWSITSQKTQFALILLTVLGWLWLVHGNYHEMECWLDQVQLLPGIHNYPRENDKLILVAGQLQSSSRELVHSQEGDR